MMVSTYPLWWLALPLLLLPIWWHRQKRQRIKAELLATARFLPSAPPEQLRVWQWRDKLLLLVRCLLLIVLIAWLAAVVFPWRGDTALLDAGADQTWAEQQITAAGFGGAARMPLPPSALQWLRQNERDWRTDARILIIARANQIAMPARIPQFSHAVTVRTQMPPASAAIADRPAPNAAADRAAPPVAPSIEQRIVLSAESAHADAWRSLFAAFDVAGGGGTARHTLTAEPDARTSLIIWDQPNIAPPANWRAPHWWSTAAAFPELANAVALTANGITLKYADTARGRVWTSDVFPPRDASTARTLYDTWQALAATPAPAYAMPSQSFAAASLPAIKNAKPEHWLALILLALFILERTLTHARRN